MRLGVCDFILVELLRKYGTLTCQKVSSSDAFLIYATALVR